jgi:hypothetical protein
MDVPFWLCLPVIQPGGGCAASNWFIVDVMLEQAFLQHCDLGLLSRNCSSSFFSVF